MSLYIRKVKMKRLVLAMLAIISCVGTIYGQDGNNVTYYLSNLPQRVRLNPAYQPEYKVWVGLPGLSGISVNYLNSSFGLDDLLQKDGKDSLYVDIDRMYKSLRKRNIISFNNENSLLTVGVKIKSWYATFDVTQKNDFVFRANKDLFTFLKNGNRDYIGKTMDLGKLGLKVSMYDEFALGLSKQLNPKWTIGARVKFLLGIANVDMRNSKISVHTKADGNSLELYSKQDIRLSAPVTIAENVPNGGYIDWDDFDFDMDDFEASMVLNTDNPGVALDLGAEYRLNEKIKLYASLTDLGFIHWGAKNYRFTQDTRFDWKGADISNSINSNRPGHKDIDDAFDDMVDSLKDNFRLLRGEGTYTTMLHARFYAGGEYELSRMLTVGGLVQMTMMEKAFYPSLTASANARLLRNFSASLSYTVMPGNYVNLGVGLTAKLGPAQLYVSTDNVMAADYTSTQSLGGRFGINLLFGHKDHKKRKKEQEIVPETIVVPIKKVQEVEKDSVLKDTVQVPEVLPSAQPEEVMVEGGDLKRPYHIILGSFKSRQRALRFKERLVEKGLEESCIMQNETGMYRVSCISYPEREEAWAKTFEIRKKYPKFNDAWVLRVN